MFGGLKALLLPANGVGLARLTHRRDVIRLAKARRQDMKLSYRRSHYSHLGMIENMD
jgi:hypothetical protein